MLKLNIIYLGIVCMSSCTLLRPLPLLPIEKNDIIQRKEFTDLSTLNGNYQLLSVDSSSVKLDFAFTYKSFFNFKKHPGINDYINLSAIDNRHIKASLFVNNKMVKSKTIKGWISNNYFQFSTNHFSLRYIFIIYTQQTNRVSLLKEGHMALDNNRGGIGFLLILPIPLSGSSIDTYDLIFKKIN